MTVVRTAAGWTRPYTSMQWAWVRALGVEPSVTWRDERPRVKRRGTGGRELRECFANERRVLL